MMFMLSAMGHTYRSGNTSRATSLITPLHFLIIFYLKLNLIKWLNSVFYVCCICRNMLAFQTVHAFNQRMHTPVKGYAININIFFQAEESGACGETGQHISLPRNMNTAQSYTPIPFPVQNTANNEIFLQTILDIFRIVLHNCSSFFAVKCLFPVNNT